VKLYLYNNSQWEKGEKGKRRGKKEKKGKEED